ncbi:DUF6808 domain-containing protein [uncultured Rikenella sp.]|uniref:DUF6808 domain-containing protein n=2 Tax=uncultured Rikenella sp. TaxID=368003 RepID=UPI002628C339|nr:hypothetical protein [uncultured Rikenella sp.]
MKNLMTVLLVVAVIAGCFLWSRWPGSPIKSEPARTDTVVVRDTIREPIPVPVVRTVVRYDTVRVALPAVDSLPGDSAAVVLPIERKTYETEDYRAVVEGYKPSLVEMEIYRQSTTITNTVMQPKRPRWALTVGPGIGYGPHGVQPYVGASFGFVLWSK